MEEAVRYVGQILQAAGIIVGTQDPDGSITGQAAVNDGHSHGSAVVIYPNVPGATVMRPSDAAIRRRQIMSDCYAALLYDASLCPASRLGWNNGMLVIPYEGWDRDEMSPFKDFV